MECLETLDEMHVSALSTKPNRSLRAKTCLDEPSRGFAHKYGSCIAAPQIESASHIKWRLCALSCNVKRPLRLWGGMIDEDLLSCARVVDSGHQGHDQAIGVETVDEWRGLARLTRRLL